MDGGLSTLALSPAFAFHAAAPPGEWINDPNGLAFSGGRYRLFVQHRADAPEFAVTGWARLSSDDLLKWEWDGSVLPPDANGWAYSGSVMVAPGGALESYHTRHDKDGGPVQTQHRATSRDAGATWETDFRPLGPSGRNVRDPFVFAYRGERQMLVARPCDWTDWANDPASTIEVLASPDGAAWRAVGTIGPFAPPGIMWEVPVLVDFGSCWALIVSIVDRRTGTACGVRYWLGTFDGMRFACQPGWPQQGRALDLGPDFYACIPNTTEGWPDEARVLVGWASSWATARRVAWPGGAAGGPIGLPRRLTLDAAGTRLRQEPIEGARGKARAVYRTGNGSFRLVVTSSLGEVKVVWDAAASALVVDRQTDDPLFRWNGQTRLNPCSAMNLTLFIDGPLIEIFIEPAGTVITLVLPGVDLEPEFQASRQVGKA